MSFFEQKTDNRSALIALARLLARAAAEEHQQTQRYHHDQFTERYTSIDNREPDS